jgi:DNA-3-methyladenine glycosylase
MQSFAICAWKRPWARCIVPYCFHVVSVKIGTQTKKSPSRLTFLNKAFFSRDVVAVARDLIGMSLSVDAIGGLIVETEAYARNDAASHSYGGKTVRNASMFGPAGRAYVYRSYGLHWCLNFVCLDGSAVLIRALEPRHGIGLMKINRGVDALRLLCAGPGRFTQALGINASHDGLDLAAPPFAIEEGEAVDVVAGTRIGIRKAADYPWRFGKKGSTFLSRQF